MKKETLSQIIAKWHNIILASAGIERIYENQILKSLGSAPIKIITGFRRSGKSYMIRRIAKRLIDEKRIEIKDILYLNFEDFALRTVKTPEDLNEILEYFLATSNPKAKKLLIFDEIQNIHDWDKFIRTIYELNSNNMQEIIITGSNSELLSAELGSNLAGRFIEFRIQPFLFKEYIKYNSLEVNSEADYYRLKPQINSLFYSYMKFGGLPEVLQIIDDDTKQSYLTGILSKVVLDDIVKRFKVRNSDLLDMLLKYLLSNIGNHSSMLKLQKYLASQSFKIDINTLFKYINYYPKTFVLYDLLEFNWKNSKVLNINKKFYAVDTGVANLHPPSVGNFSKQLENLVYLQLLSKYDPPDIFYANTNKCEIDFIVQQPSSILKIQVTQELNTDNEARELGSFAKVDKYLNSGENLLISLDDVEEVINYKKIKIRKVNLIKWLLL